MATEVARGRGGKLIRGARVALLSPEWARPCSACEEFWYEDSGRIKRGGDGEPVKRPPGAPTPCQSCAKVPRWAKEAGKDWKECRGLADEISPQNEQALEAYREFRAVGRFPDDPVVRWYAGILAEVHREADLQPAQVQTAAIQSLVQLLTVRALRR